MKTIFIVDDSDVNLLTAEQALADFYQVFTLASAEGMFELLEDITPDLILLDIEMPGMNGFEALKILKAGGGSAGIPVIFLTSRNDADTEVLGFELGAIDFIGKPFSAPVLINRLRVHLNMEGIIKERTEEVRILRNNIVSVFSRIIENRDKLTGSHVERTAACMGILLKAMLERGVYSGELEKWDFEAAVLSARLHDIGKIAVEDLFLNKERLTDEEFKIMKTHAAEGEKIIDEIIAKSGGEDFLHNAKLFAGYHHERWDGAGYPRGLKGADIPLQGRVMALIDGYDAIISERPYKRPLPHDKAVQIIAENKGTQFDPEIVDVFLEVSGLFAEVNI